MHPMRLHACSIMSHSLQPYGLYLARLLCPWDSPGKNTGVGCHFLLQCMKSEVTQSCPTLSDPMDCSLPGSFVHGNFQARVLEWGAIAFSTGYMPRVEISGSYAGFIPSFKGIAIPSSIVAVSIYTPTSSARVFPFLHTFSRIYCL